MKFLFDQNLSYKLCREFSIRYPGSSQALLLELDKADDRAIWLYAQTNGFMLVSQGSDMADMAALYGPPPKVIWLRCGNQPTEIIARLLREHARDIEAFDQDVNAACLEIY